MISRRFECNPEQSTQLHIFMSNSGKYCTAVNFRGIQFFAEGPSTKILQSNFRGRTFQYRDVAFRLFFHRFNFRDLPVNHENCQKLDPLKIPAMR